MKAFALTLLAAATLYAAPALMQGTPLSATAAFAKHGADDPAGDQRRGRGTDDGSGHASSVKFEDLMTVARRGRGADDGAGHTRRCRGCDDGPNHT